MTESERDQTRAQRWLSSSARPGTRREEGNLGVEEA